MRDQILALLKYHEYLTGDEIRAHVGVDVNSTLGGMVSQGAISCTSRPWVNGVRETRRYYL